MERRVTQRPRTGAVLVVAFALASAGCGERKADAQECRRSRGAEVCLIADGSNAYELKGSGFRPGSEVRLTVDNSRPHLLTADERGSIPSPGRTVGVHKGATPQRATLVGSTASGEVAEFVFEVPAA